MTAGPASGGKARRLRRLLRDDGRAALVALDHAAYMVEGPPPACYGPIAAAGPDGVLATWHQARSHAATFAGTGLVLRVDGGASDLGEADETTELLYGPDDALAVGADAVVLLVFPGSPDERRTLTRLAQLCAECEPLGLPVMAEVIPGGWSRAVPWTTETVAAGARIAVELGADIVKTVCPGPPEEFGAVVRACGAPVVALGGPRTGSEDEVVALAKGVVAAGAAGIAFGRNVWGSPDPGALVARLVDAVHG